MRRTITSVLAAGIFVATSPFASAQDSQPLAEQTGSAEPQFATFTPSTTPNRNRIDYTIWDEAMESLVFRMGRSLRQNPGRPAAGFGSRRMFGHVSRYRLEGNRIMFSFLDDDIKQTFNEYRIDLERVGTELDIATLSRNEQLAYWINLHNVAVIEQIANAWPVLQPRSIEIDGVPMDVAKFITVKGVSMSPKDIRTQIVYQHWKNPKVAYAFWRGDIGGPSIQAEAYTAENVGRLLDKSANEFVNSLRGVQKSGNSLQISEIYEEARPFYFPNWPQDVRTHISEYAEEDVEEILQKTTVVEANLYEADIADLAGGRREPSYSNITSDGTSISFRVPQGMARLLSEHQTKVQRIIREGRTGTVTFENITLPGEEGEAATGEIE